MNNLFSSNPGTLAHLFCKNLAKIHPQMFLNKKIKINNIINIINK
jgi:hypothetical protein